MKIAVLSDIHGNGVALSYVLEDLKKQNINKAIILGDVVMKGPMPMEVLDGLESLQIMGWIQGNTDMWLKEVSQDWIPETDREKELYNYFIFAKENMTVEKIEWISALPFECSLELNGFKILGVHGTPKSIVEAIDDTVPVDEVRESIRGMKEDILLCGHSHTTFIGEVDGKRIFNVGSIGNSMDADNSASYGILDFSKGHVELINKRVQYPISKIIEVAKDRNFPNIDEYEKMIRNASMN